MRELDLRYVGQSTELTISEPRTLDDAVAGFHQRHERRYGFAARADPVEIVTVRAVAIGISEKPALTAVAVPPAREPRPDALHERRMVYDSVGFVATPVYGRTALRPGDTFDGPAVVEQYDATTYVAPGWRAHVDGFMNLVLEFQPADDRG